MQKNKKKILLDHKFWSRFAKNNWEHKPLLLKNITSPLLQMDDTEVFDLLLHYANDCRKRKDSSGFKFFIEGEQVNHLDVLQILPIKKDKTFLGYHARMNKLFTDYCLVCDELLKSNLNSQSLLTDFTSELYRHIGFPNRFSEMGLYLGNYRKTPFGVHVDKCGVFSFPVVGEKKFRLWTSDYVKKNPKLDRSFNYAKYKKNSQVMVAVAGDMAYWPSSAFHIAESDGSFSATWSLGVWVDKSHNKAFSETLNLLVEEKSASFGNARMTLFDSLNEDSGEVKKLPNCYSRSIKLLQNLTKNELNEAFLKSWILHISSQGFKNTPQVEFKLSLNSKIQLRNRSAKILWQKCILKKTKINFSFGGILIEIEKPKNFLRLVLELNAGKKCLISEYLKGALQKHDLKVLQTFAQAGAFS